MRSFLQRHQADVLGVLSGYDRLRFRGTYRWLTSVGGVVSFLTQVGVLLKDFLGYAEGLTQLIRRTSENLAQRAGLRVDYLPGKTDKEALIAERRAEGRTGRDGLIAVLSTLENCLSYDLYRDRQQQQIALRRRLRKCLHYYFYFQDDFFGLAQVRLQTWFPFDVRVVLNGREWLARRMDAVGLGYLRRDNCFPQVEDFAATQQLLDRQPRLNWPWQLDRLVRQVHPLYRSLFPACPQAYYWTSDQSEWATDIAFRSAEALRCLYPVLLRRGIDSLGSADVMRFLGHRLPAHGGVHGRFAGEIVSDLRERPEGIRLKHRVGANTIKMYDKFGTVLRIETTLNDVQGLKVFRYADETRSQPRQWLPLRKTVADMPRRAQLSQAANQRYLKALASFDAQTPLGRLADKLCQAVQDEKGRRHRALNPLAGQDACLLEIVARGEFTLTGFRNRDVRLALYGETTCDEQRRRQASAVTRKLALLRAHGLIRKIPDTHRYLLSQAGKTAIPAFLAARRATLDQLETAA